MNFTSSFTASGRRWWWPGCVLALAGLVAGLCYLNGRVAADSGRLYWEYAGRILHAPVTNGYIQWIQHRAGSPPALDTAARAARQLAPYSDFPSEYPPGSLLYFAGVRYFSDGLFGFSRLIHLVSAAMFFAVMAIALRTLRIMQLRTGGQHGVLLFMALPLVALSPLLIGPFALIRFDMLPTFFAVVGLALFLERMPLAAAFMLGIGASAKLWPGIFLPLIMANYWQPGERVGRPVAMAIIGMAGFAIPHLAMVYIGTNPADVFNYLQFLGDRPPQIESTVANLVVVLSHLTGSPISGGFDFGSQNVYASFSSYAVKTASVLNAACLVFAFFTVLRRTRDDPHSAKSDVATLFACGLCVCITMACSRVFSSEYMMWPLPLVMFLFLDRRGAIGIIAFVSSLVLLKVIYWDYDDIIAVKLGGTLICLAKNVLFLIVAGTFGWGMVNYRSAPQAAGRPTRASGGVT